MGKTIHKMSQDVLQEMWTVGSYVPLFRLRLTEMFLLIKGFTYTHTHAFHAKGIHISTEIGNQN